MGKAEMNTGHKANFLTAGSMERNSEGLHGTSSENFTYQLITFLPKRLV